MRRSGWLLLCALGGCSSAAHLTVLAGSDALAAVTAFAELTPGVRVAASANPISDLAATSGPRAALSADLSCGDCFSIEPRGNGAYIIHGGGLLGLQYGLAQLLEEGGFRFFHPRGGWTPPSVSLPDTSAHFNVQFTPEKKLRGLHLHTIHPIEAHFDFWQPSPEHLDGARRVIDWLVKNRGNYLQWPALNDITKDAATLAAWQAHTRAILDYAHLRGITTGIGVELFASGNKQNAYDLLSDSDAMSADTTPIIAAGLSALLGDLPFDKLSLSFGEFFSEEPDQFVAQINASYDALQSLRPGMEMTALIHVGNEPSQHIQYMGMDLLYYFLVQFANPAIIPWIHTVMYYNLFEDAGGAYSHDDFSPHRQFLLNRLAQHQRVVYFPESAYWVAFDDPVPTYLPLYMMTRWIDMTDIDQQTTGDALSEHVEFSSGWEWGYWQNDYAALRMSFQRPDHWSGVVEDMFAPKGAAGAALAAQVEALGQLQHDALIGQRLAPYLAGDDFLLDSGYTAGIISQPHRPSFADVAALSAADRTTFTSQVLDPLDQFAAATATIAAAVGKIELGGDPWFDEIRDGVTVDSARLRFVAALYRAVVTRANGEDVTPLLSAAEAALAGARRTIAHRHAHLHDPDPARILVEGENATVYKYGYLEEADTLCYWERERGQARQQLLGTTESIPGCVLGF